MDFYPKVTNSTKNDPSVSGKLASAINTMTRGNVCSKTSLKTATLYNPYLMALIVIEHLYNVTLRFGGAPDSSQCYQ